MTQYLNWALLCLSAFAAGIVNSIAGGGTLLTFPSLLTVVPDLLANTTSTVALVPLGLSSRRSSQLPGVSTVC